jgi:uncharacterized protein
MKNIFSTLGILFIPYLMLAQQEFKPETKRIEVTGTAESEVIPDEIFYSITLREYKDNNKVVDITVLERQLVKAVEQAGIPKENFSIENVYGYKDYWDKSRKPQDFLASKQYSLKLNNLYKINEIMDKVDQKGISAMNINNFSYSKIEELKKQVKKKAVQAAREKAVYLLEAVNEQVGEVLLIQEIGDGYYGPMYDMARNATYKTIESAQSAEPAPEIDTKKIKVSYQIRAVFRIK